MPRISVIVPVYKVEKYLDRCVQSLLNQTYADFELILVDDGSPDRCPIICDDYAKQDNRVVVIHQQNNGLSSARNAGIDWAFSNSNSEWLSFIDSDDWVHPDYLKCLYEATNALGTDISSCVFEQTSGKTPEFIIELLTPRLYATETFFFEYNLFAVVAVGKLYRKLLFKDVRYPVGRLHEDALTTHKLLFQREKIAVIFAPLYAYYSNPKSIMHTTMSFQRLTDSLDAFTERLDFFQKIGNKTAYHHTLTNYLSELAHLKKHMNRYWDKESKKAYMPSFKKRVRDALKKVRVTTLWNACMRIIKRKLTKK